jgi:hypothetical protein
VNIFAFLSSTFFSTVATGTHDETVAASLRIGIGFGLLNMIFSAVAFFFIDPLDQDMYPIASQLRGRRFLLLLSLSAGAVILFITAFSFDIHNSHRAGTIIAFVYIFVIFYSPGAGCIPFLYSSEVWGNESRLVAPPVENFIDCSQRARYELGRVLQLHGRGTGCSLYPPGPEMGAGQVPWPVLWLQCHRLAFGKGAPTAAAISNLYRYISSCPLRISMRPSRR